MTSKICLLLYICQMFALNNEAYPLLHTFFCQVTWTEVSKIKNSTRFTRQEEKKN